MLPTPTSLSPFAVPRLDPDALDILGYFLLRLPCFILQQFYCRHESGIKQSRKMSCTFATETFFGPVVSSCRREFDFTLSFEEIFFKLTPACLLLVLAGTRVFVLARRPAKGSLGVLYVLKLVRSSPISQI